MNWKEEDVRILLEDAQLDIESDHLKEGADKGRRAMQIAQDIGNEELIKQVEACAHELFEKFGYNTENQSIELDPIETDGLILDIGGGGEGIIGKLNGKNVVAIDPLKKELEETQNDALKIVMDATDLKFLSKTFTACTAFFSLMYIPDDKHLKVFKEAYRVLKNGGKFLLWDIKIPKRLSGYRLFVVHMKIRLPTEEVETGYGTSWDKIQNITYFKKLARKTGFRVMKEWSRGEIFHLEMTKRA
jgi:ubiquinone/menaquinone biosynthesis C-methylase UbiE